MLATRPAGLRRRLRGTVLAGLAQRMAVEAQREVRGDERGRRGGVTWDLRWALLRKGEVETARLDDFAFRLRVRTFRLVAEGLEPACPVEALVREAALLPDAVILERLLERRPELTPDRLHALVDRCRARAREQLVAERGDPSPHRLA